jgi:hypothetical protein
MGVVVESASDDNGALGGSMRNIYRGAGRRDRKKRMKFSVGSRSFLQQRRRNA